MEQQYYPATINPDDLADYLTARFNVPLGHTIAQKVQVGERQIVQIAIQDHRHHRHGPKIRSVLSVEIAHTTDGILVSYTSSQWYDDVRNLVGATFFPPIVAIFSITRGVFDDALYREIRSAVDFYCNKQSGQRNERVS